MEGEGGGGRGGRGGGEGREGGVEWKAGTTVTKTHRTAISFTGVRTITTTIASNHRIPCPCR